VPCCLAVIQAGYFAYLSKRARNAGKVVLWEFMAASMVCVDNGSPAAGGSSLLTEAYTLSLELTAKLRLLQEPLRHLPLAVWHSSTAQPTYTFPAPGSGKWVTHQKATDASMFLSRHLSHNYPSLLTQRQLHLLVASVPFMLCLLRWLWPHLPTQHDVLQAHQRVCHQRLTFRNGWLDTSTLEFHTLPYQAAHMVFGPALPYCVAGNKGNSPCLWFQPGQALAL